MHTTMNALEDERSPTNTINLAICGGGLGGLMLAHVLTHYLIQNKSPNSIGETESVDFKIDIYESTPAFSAVGAGIMVWSRTDEILKEVGLGDVLQSLAAGRDKQPRITFRYGHQPDEGDDFYELEMPYGTMNLHRAELLKVLTDAIAPSIQSGLIRVHYSKKLASYTYAESSSHNGSSNINSEQNDTNPAIGLRFTDNTHASADILIGADGVRSATRASMYSHLASHYPPNSREREDLLKHVEPSWTGTFAYRAMAYPAKLRDVRKDGSVSGGGDESAVGVHRSAIKGVVYFGRDQHVAAYPISQGKLINVTGYVTDFDAEGLKLSSTDTGPSPSPQQMRFYEMHGDPIPMFKESNREEILQCFKEGEWEEDVVSLFGCVDTLSRWAITVVGDLPYLFDHEEIGGKGRVAILGDAAHSMAPFNGSGVGQAMEDAYILGRLLTHPLLPLSNKKHYLNTLPSLFRIYEKVRMPIIRRAFENTRSCGMIFEGRLSSVGDDGETEPSNSKYDGRILSPAQLRPHGEEINRLFSWQWTGPLINDEQWIVAENMLRVAVCS